MAYEKLTDRTELTTAADADLVHVVDVDDTGVDAAGNSKKIQVSNLMKSAPVQSVNGRTDAVTGLAEVTYVDTEVGNEETARIAADANLQSSITTNATAIATNTSGVSDLDTRLTTAEGDITTNATAITTEASTRAAADTALQTDVDANTAAISAEATARANADTNLQSQISSNDSDITALQGRVTTAEGEIDTLQAADYVNTLNGVDGAVTIAAGSNVTVSTAGQTITISSSGGGSGGGNKFDNIDGVTADSGSSAVDFVEGANVTITPDNSAKTITFAVSGLDTDDVAEAGNKYYTEAKVSANSSVVANTAKNSYPTADASKLAGIEAGAEVNPTAAEVKTAYESNADTNAFTNSEQSKLAGIAAGAEVNVNANWDATSGDAAILNKPSIPTDLTDLGDTPATLGSAGQVLAVATGGTTTEWVDQSGGTSLTDTDDLTEGTTNFYYTDTRVNTYLVAQKIRANYPTATYTGNTAITATHEQTMMVGNSPTGITFQVSAGLEKDCEILVMQYGAGDITITGATGVTIRTSSSFQAVTGGQYAIIGLKQIGTTDVYIVTGERKSA